MNTSAFKPNQVVQYTNKNLGYSHPVEVMSFVTPDNTYMVRRVPGYPGTLEEVSAQTLKEMTWRPARVVYVRVARAPGFRLPFPTDMLRYDAAAPVNFTLDDEGNPSDPDPAFGFEGLVVAIATPRNRIVAWTSERWASFGWVGTQIAVESL